MKMLLALLWVFSFGVPTPTPAPIPSPTPDMLLMPAGDIGGEQPTPESSFGQLENQGPRTLHIRVCVDTNQNMRCDFREGIAGVPVYLTDTASGAVLAEGTTDDSGLFSTVVDTDASLSVHAPYLNVSELLQQDAIQLRIAYDLRPPKELP